MSIFKAYDIRGTVPDQLNEELAYNIGRAFVTFLDCDRVVVGRDVRSSSGAMFKALAEGIMDQGADVIDIGPGDTPMLYFAAQGHPAAINITASHNPPKYNGFKICRENAIPISGATGIKDVERICSEGSFKSPVSKGKIIKKDVLGEFAEYQRKFLRPSPRGKKMRVVVDGANGAGTLTFPTVFKGVDFELIPLFMEPDGTFPNHEANPLVEENLESLKRKVIETGADLGAALDGDADRCMFVDENGRTLRADIVGGVIARTLLKTHKGATILYDLRSTRAAAEDIESLGGKAVKCRVGHAFIKQQMREHDAIFASELSGHFYFKDHFFTESSALALINIVNLMNETGLNISKLAEPVLRYAHSGEINFEVEDKEGVLRKLESTYGEKGRVSRLDGLSIDFDNWWFNVRASNTEPLLRLNLEAPSQDDMESHKGDIVEIITGG